MIAVSVRANTNEETAVALLLVLRCVGHKRVMCGTHNDKLCLLVVWVTMESGGRLQQRCINVRWENVWVTQT